MASAAEHDPLPVPAWAHAYGLLDLGAPVPLPGPAGDRAAFTECIARYCWAYDERRLDRLADCFTADAIWEGSVLGRVAVGPFVGREAIVEWLGKFWPHQRDQRRHMLLNTIVDGQEAEAATTLSYLLLMSSTGEAVSVEATGFYRVDYHREGEAWRIARLTAGFDKPFWPGQLATMSAAGRARHGVLAEA